MPGLIPLMLNPVAAGNRSSVIFTPSQPKGHTRGQSINGPSLPINSPMSPSFPSPVTFNFPRRASLPVLPKPKAAKRSSMSSPSSLPMIPYTPEDWRRAIADAKKQHMSRRYRACFARCNEILDNVKENTDVEPAYLISLHFYAATAMEACARPLAAPSSYRDSLLQQARSHYEQADHLINNAEESALIKHRMSFALSPSPSPSPHSPSGSISSRAWSSETGFSSPAPSECSSEDLNTRLRQSQSPPSPTILSPSPRPVKKVSFELPKPSAPRFEPYIRPDSPTLGFDDEYFQTGFARQELPEIPVRAKTPEPIMIQIDEEETTPRASKSLNFFRMSSDISSDESVSSRRSSITDAPASRYCAHLTSLKTQLARHRANLETVIATPPVVEEASDVYTFRCPTPVDEGAQAIDRKARIERLRKNGWQRKRFDPSRYEALRYAAIAELD